MRRPGRISRAFPNRKVSLSSRAGTAIKGFHSPRRSIGSKKLPIYLGTFVPSTGCVTYSLLYWHRAARWTSISCSGSKDPRMTQRYAHLRDRTLKNASNVATDILTTISNQEAAQMENSENSD